MRHVFRLFRMLRRTSLWTRHAPNERRNRMKLIETWCFEGLLGSRSNRFRCDRHGRSQFAPVSNPIQCTLCPSPLTAKAALPPLRLVDGLFQDQAPRVLRVERRGEATGGHRAAVRPGAAGASAALAAAPAPTALPGPGGGPRLRRELGRAFGG